MWNLFSEGAIGYVGTSTVTDDIFDRPLTWQAQALCVQTDPEAFFSEKGGSTREAKTICTQCGVHGQCLEHTLVNGERSGIWGSLSERERRRFKRRVS